MWAILSGGVRVDDGLLTLLGFFLTGFFVAWHNGRRIPLAFIVQFVVATLLIRQAQSFLAYHLFMREGLWVFVWPAAAIFGIWCARPQKKGA